MCQQTLDVAASDAIKSAADELYCAIEHTVEHLSADIWDEEEVANEIGDTNCSGWHVYQHEVQRVWWEQGQLKIDMVLYGEGEQDGDRMATPNKIEINVTLSIGQKTTLSIREVELDWEGFGR